MARVGNRFLSILCGFTVLFFLLPGLSGAAEELVFKGTVSSQYVGNGKEVSWQHDVNISADVLARVTKAVLEVEATDVDYPNCSAECPDCSESECEHDRLFINGTELGLLKGADGATQVTSFTVPLASLQTGSNTCKVVNEVISGSPSWGFTLISATLRLYVASEPAPGDGLKIIKKQYKSTILPGETQTYLIIVRNNGKKELTNIKVTDSLDPALEYLSTTSGMVHSQQGNRHIWTAKKLAAGQEIDIRLRAKVSQTLFSGKAVSNSADVIASGMNKPLVSNTVTALTSYVKVDPDDLRVSKRVNRREGRIGRILVYQIAVENSSPGTVFNLVLDDYLPNGFTLVEGKSLRDGQKVSNSGSMRHPRWKLGVLLPGARTSLSYQVVIGTNAKRGRNINRAEVAATDGGGNKLSGADEATVMIGGGDIEIPAEIRAMVFMDNDGNGMRNSDDEPLAGIGVILSKGEKRVSDNDGLAVFADLESGFYSIAVDPRTLPPYSSVQGDSTRLVRLMEGESSRVMLPVKRDLAPAVLYGMVYTDRNRDNAFQKGEEIAEPVKVVLDGRVITKTKKGHYIFGKLLSGSHTLGVRLGKKNIEKEMEVMAGDNEYNIALPYGGVILSIEESK